MAYQAKDLEKVKFTRAEVLNFARELWVSFNSFNMYGPEHPVAAS